MTMHDNVLAVNASHCFLQLLNKYVLLADTRQYVWGYCITLCL